MIIHIGVIEHRHGFNAYAGKTREAMIKQVAEFCREWWTEIQGWHPDPPTGNDEQDVKTYFGEYNDTEFLTTHETTLED